MAPGSRPATQAPFRSRSFAARPPFRSLSPVTPRRLPCFCAGGAAVFDRGPGPGPPPPSPLGNPKPTPLKAVSGILHEARSTPVTRTVTPEALHLGAPSMGQGWRPGKDAPTGNHPCHSRAVRGAQAGAASGALDAASSGLWLGAAGGRPLRQRPREMCARVQVRCPKAAKGGTMPAQGSAGLHLNQGIAPTHRERHTTARAGDARGAQMRCAPFICLVQGDQENKACVFKGKPSRSDARAAVR
jgi:hypothetical protein